MNIFNTILMGTADFSVEMLDQIEVVDHLLNLWLKGKNGVIVN